MTDTATETTGTREPWKDCIAEDLWPLAIDIELLDPLPGNPRRGAVEAVMASYTKFGQLKPVTANPSEDGRWIVTAGNHQLQAAKELGWTRLAIVRTDHTDAEAKAWAVADNRTSDLAYNDDAALLAFLRDVQSADPELLLAASYHPDDLDDLLYAATSQPTGVSNAERLNGYEAAGIRSVVLPYKQEDYDRVWTWLATARERLGVPSNSDVVFVVLERTCAETDTPEG